MISKTLRCHVLDTLRDNKSEVIDLLTLARVRELTEEETKRLEVAQLKISIFEEIDNLCKDRGRY